MTALTGETGAGKTMLVEALELLVGGRADPTLVRPGADEATIEGRFVLDDEEVVLARVVPAVGRSRAYVNGRLAPASALAEWGTRFVDLHGQHEHQSLLSIAVQRHALDQYGRVDLTALLDARAEVASIDRALSELGGDERSRAREIDLVRFQVDELDRAAVDDPLEEDRLTLAEDALANAQAHRDAATVAGEALSNDGGVGESIGAALAAIAGRAPFASIEERLRTAVAELTDIATEIRSIGEGIDDDPAQLDVVRARRHLLFDLRRKYGETLAEVI